MINFKKGKILLTIKVLFLFYIILLLIENLELIVFSYYRFFTSSLILVLLFACLTYFIYLSFRYTEKDTKGKINNLFISIFIISIIVSIYLQMFTFEETSLQSLVKSNNLYPLLISLVIISSGILSFALGKQVKINEIIYSKVLNFKEDIEISNNKKFYILILIVIMLVGLYLRLNGINELSVWVDEATTLIVSERISEGLGQTLIGGESYPRAFVYHKYLGSLISIFGHPEYIGRIANTLFYLIICITLFIFGKRLKNTETGLISVFLFTFSWVSITMFREIRFYEMFLALTTVLYFLLYKLYIKFFYSAESKKIIHLNNTEIKSYLFILFIILLVAAVSYDTQSITALLIYPIILIGILSIFNGKSTEKKGMLLLFSSITLLVLGAIFKYKGDFEMKFLFLAPQPEWKIELGNFGFYDFINYLVINDYWYLIIFIPTSLFLLYKTKDPNLIFLNSFMIALYCLISLQGYGASAIRYYYILFPIIFLLIAYISTTLLESLQKRQKSILNFFLFSLLSFITIITIYSGIRESFSVYSFTSKNEIRNIDYDDAFKFLSEKISVQTTVIMDDQLNMPYFSYFKKTPDYYLILSNAEFKKDKRNFYVDNLPIKYNDPLILINERVIVAYIKRERYFISGDSTLINNEFTKFFSENGKLIYNTDSIAIYMFDNEI